jgi:hypothetical protein
MKIRKPKMIGGYQNTKINKEDFALTPYLFIVFEKLEIISAYGIGLCWGHHSTYIGFGFGIPKDFPTFRNHKDAV